LNDFLLDVVTVRTVLYRCSAVTGGSRKPLIYIMSAVGVLTQLVGNLLERSLKWMLNLADLVEDGELVIVLVSRRKYSR
jgi:hypothetical protein